MSDVLVHLGAGIGNIVLATPLLVALEEMGFRTDLMLSADYQGSEELLLGWSAVRRIRNLDAILDPEYAHILPAIPPFYWFRFRHLFTRSRNVLTRPPDSLFYADEQEFYLYFARALGYPPSRKPSVRLPIVANLDCPVSAETVVLAPGCKTGEMALKRWPYFGELAQRFEDVAVVGTTGDLFQADGRPIRWPRHARNLAGRLTLRQSCEVLAAAGIVVANDSGLGHAACAVGTPSLLLFGPTPHKTLGRMPGHVRVVRSNLPCEPCWFARRLAACSGAVTCLANLSVDQVEGQIRAMRHDDGSLLSEH